MVVPGDGTSNSTAPSDTVLPDTTTTDSSDDTNLPWCDELPNNGETDSSTDDTSEVDDTGVDGTGTDGTSTATFANADDSDAEVFASLNTTEALQISINMTVNRTRKLFLFLKRYHC